MNSAIFYLLVILISTFLALLTQIIMNLLKSKGYSDKFSESVSLIPYLCSFFIAFLVSATRLGIGTDYNLYINMNKLFNENLSIAEQMRRIDVEPGWVVVNLIVKQLFNDPHYVIVVASLIFVGCAYISIYLYRDKISITIAILLLMCTIYFQSFNLIRQYIAIGILMISIKSIEDKKLFKFLMFNILAFLFHYTSICFVIVYFYVNIREKNKSKKILMLFCVFILLLFYNQLISIIAGIIPAFSKYIRYSAIYADGISIRAFIFKLPVIIFILYFGKRLKYNNIFMHNFKDLYYLFVILSFLNSVNPFASRIGFYYEIVQIYYIAYAIRTLKYKQDRLIINGLVIIYYIFYYYINFIYFKYHEVIPYSNIWGMSLK